MVPCSPACPDRRRVAGPGGSVPSSDASVQREQLLAETLAAEEALEALPRLAADFEAEPAAAQRLRGEYEEQLRVLRAGTADTDDEELLRSHESYTALRLGLLATKRETVVRLRDEDRIDDTVLRQVQHKLDIEEIRLAGHDPEE